MVFMWQILHRVRSFAAIMDFGLKLIDCLHVTRWMPPDYWQTDNSSGLEWSFAITIGWAGSRVLKSTCSSPLAQTGDRKQFSLFVLDLWLTILTYNPRLAMVKVDPHATNQGQRSDSSNRRVPTDKRTDTHTRTLPNVLSPLLRGQ